MADKYYRKIKKTFDDSKYKLQLTAMTLKLKNNELNISSNLEKIKTNEKDISSNLTKIENNEKDISSISTKIYDISSDLTKEVFNENYILQDLILYYQILFF